MCTESCACTTPVALVACIRVGVGVPHPLLASFVMIRNLLKPSADGGLLW